MHWSLSIEKATSIAWVTARRPASIRHDLPAEMRGMRAKRHCALLLVHYAVQAGGAFSLPSLWQRVRGWHGMQQVPLPSARSERVIRSV
jgi:hypothetical protein